jgi:hypothetical protein
MTHVLRTFAAFAAAVLLAAALPALAEEGCPESPKDTWQSAEEAKEAAVANGFSDIVKVILEDGCYEVVTLNANGKIVGVHIDPVSLELVKVEDPR